MFNKLLRYKLFLFPVLVLLCVVVLTTLVAALLPKFNPVIEQFSIEAGSTNEITVNQFKTKSDIEVDFLTDTSKIDLSKTGDYEIKFVFKGNEYSSKLHIVDTTPPSATALDKQIFSGESLTAQDFVTDIKDVSEVTVAFAQKPDFNAVGEQNITIKLTDTAGNVADVVAKLNIVKDTEAPKFEGLKTVSVRIGNSVSYRTGVKAVDNKDGEVKFSFDSNSVDLQKAGEYTVTYTATDSSGNTVTAERKIKVLPKLVVDEEYVRGLAKKVVSQITTKNMSKGQMADKIFRWMRNNLNYVSSPETDIVNAAYVGFTKRRGDCFNYYSMTKLMLDECGIENMMVERFGGKTTHFWHLVNVGTGWYHFDTTPQSLEDPYRCFMKTDAQVWAYAKSRHDGRSDYYNFDTSKYPERAKTNFVLK